MQWIPFQGSLYLCLTSVGSDMCGSRNKSGKESVEAVVIDKCFFPSSFEKRNPVSTHLLWEWLTGLFPVTSKKNRSQLHLCSVGVGSARHASRSHTFWSAHCCKCLISTRCTRVVWDVLGCGTWFGWRPHSIWSRLGSIRCWGCGGERVAQFRLLSHVVVAWAIVGAERVYLMVLRVLLRVENRWRGRNMRLGCCSSRLEGLYWGDLLGGKGVIAPSITLVIVGVTVLLLLTTIVIMMALRHESRRCLSVV